MKRAVAIFLISVMLTAGLLLPVSAVSDDGRTATEGILSFTCTYNSDTHKVAVSGNMDHDAFASHKDSALVIYSIPPGASAYQVASDPDSSPLAETSVSIRFGFTFSVDSIIDRYSRYAVFLRSSDGTLTLAAEPHYPEVSAQKDGDTSRAGFKGISSGSVAAMAEAAPGLAILPVYLDSLYTDSTGGYIHQGEVDILFFDKSYINELDAKINSLFTTGTKIYLELLLRGGDRYAHSESEDAEYFLPDTFDPETLSRVHFASEFLALRYGGDNDRMDGIIVGKGGEGLKRIGSYARADLEKLLDTKVYLNLWVKVKENWRESARTVTNFGYHDD